MTGMLRHELNQVLARHSVPGRAYGRASICKTFIGTEAPRVTRFDFSHVKEDTALLLQGTPVAKDLRKAMLLNSVDLMRNAGFVSAAHTPDIIEETVQAFERSIVRLQQQGAIP